MTNLNTILSPELTICNYSEAANKKQIIEKISHLVHQAHHAIKYKEILKTLQQRERLGSTAVGHGVAIPHGRVTNLEHPVCVLVTLEKAIEYGSEDAIAVDLVFGLLVPNEGEVEHLEVLAAISKKLQNKDFREKLRQAKTNSDLYQAAISEI